MSNIEDCVKWGIKEKLDIMINESAGLCNRCSPHVKDVLSICVIDCLSGVYTPKKIGPMLKLADIVVITKGDIVSQAEREVFTFRVKQSNPKASIFLINGITGQGAYDLSVQIKEGQNSILWLIRNYVFSMRQQSVHIVQAKHALEMYIRPEISKRWLYKLAGSRK
jgi:Ni2+-binding GTPase involved in maturation of urease and hydrogenase